jgi:hypothetical protein
VLNEPGQAYNRSMIFARYGTKTARKPLKTISPRLNSGFRMNLSRYLGWIPFVVLL